LLRLAGQYNNHEHRLALAERRGKREKAVKDRLCFFPSSVFSFVHCPFRFLAYSQRTDLTLVFCIRLETCQMGNDATPAPAAVQARNINSHNINSSNNSNNSNAANACQIKQARSLAKHKQALLSKSVLENIESHTNAVAAAAVAAATSKY
jgi:hypothetical protein